MQNAGSFGVLGVIAVHDKRDLLAEFFAAGEVEALQNLAPVGLERVAKMHLALKRRRALGRARRSIPACAFSYPEVR